MNAETLAALGLGRIAAERLRPMDSAGSVVELAEAGQAIAESQVRAEHFAGF